MILTKKCVRHSIVFVLIVFCITPVISPAFSQESVILQLILNEENKGDFFLFSAPDSDIWIKRNELDQLGLKEGLGRDIQFNGETFVSLGSITGLEFSINYEDVSLVITANPQLFKEHSVDISYKKPYKVTYTTGKSAFLNYAFIYDHETVDTLLDISGELGISIGNYFGMSTFIYEDTEDTNDFLRLTTNITLDNRDKLTTTTFGDFSASSGTLGSTAVLGGINFSKNFSIDPYLLKFPSLDLTGTLETPSELEIYLDNFLVRKEKLPPGEFSFSDIPATVGLGAARISIRDAYGREHIISKPYYYTDRLLKQGLHEYSYSLGAIREDFGEKSFSYGKPAFLSFHNYGFSERLTVGYTAEASNDLINMGQTASLLVFDFGVLDSVVAVSNSSEKTGLSGLLGYSFQSRNINITTSLQSSSKEYSNFTMTPSDDKARLEFSSTVGTGGKKTGFITVGYTYSDFYESVTTSRIDVSYNKALTKQTTFFMTASETKDIDTSDQIFLGLNIYFGRDVSANLSLASRDGSETNKVGIQKSLPIGPGFGYKAEVENIHDDNDIDSDLQYQNQFGLFEAGFNNKVRDNGYRLAFSGGTGYIDNSVFFSRPVKDSFAKVKINELDGVRVYYYGNEIDRTDEQGEAIIPNLRSFHDNRIDIENRDIPINYTIPSLTQYISPSYRSGALVEFNISKIQGIVGTVIMVIDGDKIPAEFASLHIRTENGIMEGLVGTEGEFYLENIPSGKHMAELVYKGNKCEFNMIIPESEEMLIDLGEISCMAE